MSAETEAVIAFNAAWDASDVDALMNLMSADPSYATSVGEGPGDIFKGRAAVRKAFEVGTARETAEPSPPPPLFEPLVAGDTVICRWSYHGRTPDGAPTLIKGVDVFEFDNGLIASIDAYRKTFHQT